MRAARALHERAGIDVDRVLRPEVEALRIRSVRRSGRQVASDIEAQSPFRCQNKTSVVERVLRRDEVV